MAGAPCYELAKEREGAPLSLPRRSCPFFIIFPSFFETALNTYASLIRAKSLKCFLGPGCAAQWTKGGLKIELQEKFSDDPAQNTMIFDIIDLNKGLAKKIMHSGLSFDVQVIKLNKQLTFIQSWNDGDIVITTIFPKKDTVSKKYLLVQSRHISVFGIKPAPQQYYGTCEIIK